MGFKRVYTKKAYQSKIFELEFRDYLDDNKELHKDIAILLSADAANVVPITNDNTILLVKQYRFCLLYTSPSPRDATLSRMPSSA